MPFTTPRFQEVGESEILDNLFEIVHRDMKLALDYFYAADNLPDFAVMTLDEDTNFVLPYFIAGVERENSLETNDGFYLDQDLKIGAVIAVRDDSIGKAKRKCQKYVRAFKAVVRSAPDSDLLPPSSRILGCVVDIEHRYLRHAQTKDGTGYVKPAEILLTFKFGEK